MTDLDSELRQLLQEAAGYPRNSDSQSLLDVLTQRIDDGGEDVADAPLPHGGLVAVDGGRPGRPDGWRAMGIGMGVWAAVIVGSAAAATTGIWLFVDPLGNDVATPTVSVTASADAHPEASGATSLPEVEWGEAAPSSPSVTPSALAEPDLSNPLVPPERKPESGPSHTSPTQPLTPPDKREEPNPGTKAPVPPKNTPPPAAPHPIVPPPVVPPPVAPAPGGVLPGVITDPIEEITEVIVVDTLGPVISAINVGSISTNLLDLTRCLTALPLSVQVTDPSGVTSVVARINVASLATVSVPLSAGSGSTWNGSLLPLGVLNLVSLNGVATVTIEATDGAGNTSTSSTSVATSTIACLL